MLLAPLAGPAAAQGPETGQAPGAGQGLGFNTGQVVSPLLTIDPDVLFSGTLYGQRIQEELRDQTEALAAENREMEAQLTEEEQSLTRRRPTMQADAFRAEARAFDARVQQIRNEQDAKERALQQIVAQGRDAFVRDASPVLGRMMLERGAAVILDRRNVFLAVGALDITQEAIARVDEALGAGDPGATTLQTGPEAPVDVPLEAPEEDSGAEATPPAE
ncbi:OmpH family outer membrane protein [Pseudoroseicyclus sp. CLL3-39]|uniref:OmpH family outer membrane protein n=2 Tax=Pseudoroseicyclus tamaricis TaxID=2705421 RepID=A0A6B2JRJ3_9RHOB|nr:OmpH family outer membrane protein [Pseudoroseicyclus tamaricis]